MMSRRFSTGQAMRSLNIVQLADYRQSHGEPTGIS